MAAALSLLASRRGIEEAIDSTMEALGWFRFCLQFFQVDHEPTALHVATADRLPFLWMLRGGKACGR
jgi:hypothetical protein